MRSLDEKRAYNAEWRATVSDEWRERKRAYNRERYQRKKAELLAYDRRYRAEHHDYQLERGRRYYAANREARIKSQTKHVATRRARLLSVPVFRFNDRDWRRLVNRYGGACAYCGKRPERLYREHVIPVSRNGSHGAGNIVPACRPCNLAKGSKTVMEWRWQEFLASGGQRPSQWLLFAGDEGVTSEWCVYLDD